MSGRNKVTLLKSASYFQFFLILTDGVSAKHRVIYVNVSLTEKISENPQEVYEILSLLITADHKSSAE